MGETRSPRLFALVLGGLLLLCAVTGGVLYALVQREDARWPSLADTSRVSAPTAPVVGDGRAWDRIAEASAGFPSDAPDFQRILEAESTPSADELSTWQPFAGRIDALRAVVTETSGLSIPQPVRFDDPGVSLLPLLKLCRAWLLSGWAHAAAGAPARGVTEMLHVQALATRLMLGDTGLVDVMVGIAIDQVATGAARAAGHVRRGDPVAVCPRRCEAGAARAGLASARARGGGAQRRGRVRHARRNHVLGRGVGLRRGAHPRLVPHADAACWWTGPRRRAGSARPLDPLPLWSVDGGLVQQLHNRTGRILLDLATADYDAMIAREDAAVAGSRLDVLLIAARRYAFDHARRPAGRPDGPGARLPPRTATGPLRRRATPPRPREHLVRRRERSPRGHGTAPFVVRRCEAEDSSLGLEPSPRRRRRPRPRPRPSLLTRHGSRGSFRMRTSKGSQAHLR
jgi:hypothetical protein